MDTIKQKKKIIITGDHSIFPGVLRLAQMPKNPNKYPFSYIKNGPLRDGLCGGLRGQSPVKQKCPNVICVPHYSFCNSGVHEGAAEDHHQDHGVDVGEGDGERSAGLRAPSELSPADGRHDFRDEQSGGGERRYRDVGQRAA